MKRNRTESRIGHLLRPQKSSASPCEDESEISGDETSSPPARKILKRLLEAEVQKAMSELNEEMPAITTKNEHRAASLIPEFDPDGEECISASAWLKKIDQLGEIHKWSETNKSFYLQDKLKGQARKWYNRLDEYDHSWADWKQMLIRAFPRHRDYGNLLEEMMNRTKLLCAFGVNYPTARRFPVLFVDYQQHFKPMQERISVRDPKSFTKDSFVRLTIISPRQLLLLKCARQAKIATVDNLTIRSIPHLTQKLTRARGARRPGIYSAAALIQTPGPAISAETEGTSPRAASIHQNLQC